MRLGRFVAVWIALVTVLAVAPSGAAAPYENSDSFFLPVGAYAAGDANTHVYDLDLDAGDTLDVTVSWATPTADMDVFANGPGLLCGFSVSCAVDRMTCQDNLPSSASKELGPDTESLSITAPETGTYEVLAVVNGGTGTPDVSYDVTIDVNSGDGAGLVGGPQTFSGLSIDAHCLFV